MAHAANWLGLVGGSLVVVVGVALGVVGWFSMGGLFAVLIGLLLGMWGGLLVVICMSNLRRASDSSRA